MKGIHNHTALLILAIAVTLVVGSVYGYMRYALAGSIERAILARDIVRVEDANKSHDQDTVGLYELTTSERAKLSEFFIPADRIVMFIEAIEGLGKQAGSIVALTTIDADKIVSAPGVFGSARAHVDAKGSWASVLRTLELAESLPYVIHIDHVRLDTSVLEGDKSGKRDWRLSFDITAQII